MTSPTSIGNVAALSGNSQIAGFDKTLRQRAVIRDVFVQLSGIYDNEKRTIPNAIYMKVDGLSTGTNHVVITLKLPLTGAAQIGNNELRGTEEEANTKHVTIYRNNYRKAVKVEEYGVRHLDQVDYGLYRKHIDDMGLWAQQYKGIEIRTALLERFSSNLDAGDLAATITPQFNSNFYVENLAESAQPDFSDIGAAPTSQLWIDQISAAISVAGGGGYTQSAAQAAKFRTFNKIAQRALNKKLWPLEIGGADAFILTLPPTQAAILSDSTFSSSGSESLASQWTSVNRLNEKMQNWYGLLGVYHTAIGVDIYCCVDHKAPRILPSGAGAPYGLVASYVSMGDVDNRSVAATHREVGFLLGKAALVEWEPEPLHFVKQDEDYFRIMGHGVAGVRGIQLPEFDTLNGVAATNGTTREYYGSMACVFSNANYN
jgi:hypothetical protein